MEVRRRKQKKTTSVNFTNISRAAFFITKVFSQIFLYLHFRLELILEQEYWDKSAHKMLVKLTADKPHNMQSFYVRIRVSAMAKWPFFKNLYPNLQSFLVFLYSNSLYASLIFWSLAIAYNEFHLY